MEKTRIIGPPGTGKTEYCINLIKDLIENGGYKLKDIAVFSFTKAAEVNVRKRAMEKLKVKEDQLDFFRTIHSYAMEKTNIKHTMIVQSPYREFLQEYNDPKHLWVQEKVNDGDESSQENLYLNIIDKATLKYGSTIEDTLRFYDEMSLHSDKTKRKNLIHVFETFEKWRKAPGQRRYTFSDVIYEFLKDKVTFDDIKVVIMDEAQDADPLNWKFFDRIEQNVEKSFIIGDPNQAIYEFKGAVPDLFLKRDVDVEKEMPKSYRLPKTLHTFSNLFIEKEKLKKVSFTEKDGEDNGVLKVLESPIESYTCIDALERRQEEVFIISRVHSQNKIFQDYLFQNNIPWLKASNKRKLDGSYFEPIVSDKIKFLIQTLDSLTMGDAVIGKEIIKIFKAMHATAGGVFTGLKKNKLIGDKSPIDPDTLYTLSFLDKEYGVKLEGRRWDEVYNDINAPSFLKCTKSQFFRFINTMIQQGKLYERPNFTIATIHGVKGMECKNVLLNTVMTKRPLQNYYRNNPMEEKRIMYTGITRSKQRLFLFMPPLKNTSNSIEHNAVKEIYPGFRNILRTRRA